MKLINKLTIGALIMTCMGSCSLYKKYELPTDNAIVADYAKACSEEADSTSFGNLGWEQVFTDPQLQALIRTALENNVDYANAKLNVDIAQANLKGAKLSYWPSVVLSPNGGGAKYGSSDMNWSYTLPLSVSWEVDVFGKLLNNKRAAKADVEKTDAYRQAVRSQIISAVARTYYALVSLNEQLNITRSTAVLWKEQVESMVLMKNAARVNEAAVVQSRANYYSILSTIPNIEAAITDAQNTMSLLLNTYPQTWSVTQNLDFNAPAVVTQGIPISYLAARPDIKAAEQTFASAFYATNLARANFYPGLVISANGGFTDLLGSMVVNPGKFFIQLAGSLTVPIFSRGKNIANLKAAKARQEQALNSFMYSILNASSEVSNAMSVYKTNEESRRFIMMQIDNLEKSVSYTQELLSMGQATYLEVLTAEQGLLQAQLNSLNCWHQKVNALITLYQALGGGR